MHVVFFCIISWILAYMRYLVIISNSFIYFLAAYLSYLALNIREAEGEGSGTRGGGLMEEDFNYQLHGRSHVFIPVNHRRSCS